MSDFYIDDFGSKQFNANTDKNKINIRDISEKDIPSKTINFTFQLKSATNFLFKNLTDPNKIIVEDTNSTNIRKNNHSIFSGKSLDFVEGSIWNESMLLDSPQDKKFKYLEIQNTLTLLSTTNFNEFGPICIQSACKNNKKLKCDEFDYILKTQSILFRLNSLDSLRQGYPVQKDIIESYPIQENKCTPALFNEGYYIKFCEKDLKLEVVIINSVSLSL